MRRYAGDLLARNSRIAVIANDAIGNFVVATPLLQMLRRQHPDATIHYFGGTRTWELQQASDLSDSTYPFHGSDWRVAVDCAVSVGPMNLVINVERGEAAKAYAAILCSEETWICGPVASSAGRKDLPFSNDERGLLWDDGEWISATLCMKYPFLESGFIGEIYARLCYLEGPVPPYKVPVVDPQIEIPDVLIAVSASLPEKLWPVENWIATLEKVHTEGLSIGLIGAKPSDQQMFWKGSTDEEKLLSTGYLEDLRGKLTLPQVAGALAKAKSVLTLDNGILHLAAAVKAPTVGLFREGIHRLWAPPVCTLSVLTAGQGKPVAEIEVKDVWEALRRAF